MFELALMMAMYDIPFLCKLLMMIATIATNLTAVGFRSCSASYHGDVVDDGDDFSLFT